MTIPTAIASEQEWNSKREALLVKEKQLTRPRDALDYPENGCPGCTMFADNLPNQLIHLNARDEYTSQELVGGRS